MGSDWIKGYGVIGGNSRTYLVVERPAVLVKAIFGTSILLLL